LAARQHGVLTRRQLLDAGVSSRGIELRLGNGRLHRVARGVYIVGRPELTRRGRWMVATLACGPRAVLSHGSAAALWGIASEPEGLIEVTLRVFSARERPGIRIYRRPSLQERDIAALSSIPVTGIVRTLIDLSTRLSPAGIERVVNEADTRNLIDPESLHAALAAYPGQWGVGKLKDVVGRRTFRLTDSELERRFLRLAHEARLPPPLTRQWINGFKVDFYWPDLGLVVETDGLRYHRTPAQQARDRLRDQAHTAAGLTPLRFTHAQVRFDAAHVRTILVETARRLGAVTGPAARGRDRGSAP
jgi:very-short-patch-repair endonuclease